MTLTHELGHVIAGILGGAKLIQLELRPWHLPHSQFASDAHPQLTLWAGPVLGCLIPLAVAVVVRRRAGWFVGWFCVLANALYLLLGYVSGDGELDSAKMIAAGTRPIELLGFVAVTLPVAYFKFRKCCIELLSASVQPMTARACGFSAAALVAILVIQSIAGSLLARSFML